jgi:hypothetical protein
VASFAAISAVATSLERLLNRAFVELQPISDTIKTRAVLVRTNDFDKSVVAQAIGSPALSVFLYRVEFNKMVRAAWSGVGSQRGLAHAPLDLHFLLTPWADNAEHELRVLGRAVQCLEENPSLSGPQLHPDGGWAPAEAIQFIPEELTVEAVMRTFDSLPTDYRLSVAYIARVVRVDGRAAEPPRPVTSVEVTA